MQIILSVLLIVAVLLFLILIYLFNKKSKTIKTPEQKIEDYSDLFEEIKKKKTKKHLKS